MSFNTPLLQLEPESTLHFNKTPEESSPDRMLKVSNLSSGNVAFKVKTTVPNAYRVKPSSGTLRPNGSQEVQIIPQPQAADSSTNAHRFLVQAVPVQSSENVSREQWAEFSKEIIQEHRLSVALEEQQREPVMIGKPTVESPDDLKVKYDELVQHTLMLEKENRKLELDLAESRSAKGTGASDFGSRVKLQVVVVAVLGFLLAYLPTLIFEKGV